jgi:THO complex subunit 2
MSWHSDPSIFDAECANHPGFLTVFRNNLNSTAANTANFNKQEQLDYENFRHVCHKWHYKLTKSFIVCLESDEYLQMRNSLIILTKILPHYPKLTAFSVALEKRVEKVKISERDKRQDLFTLASAYLGQLKIRKSSMCEEGKFHLKEVVQPSTTETDKSKATNNTTPGGVTSSAPQAAFKQPNNPKQTNSENKIINIYLPFQRVLKNLELENYQQRKFLFFSGYY